MKKMWKIEEKYLFCSFFAAIWKNFQLQMFAIRVWNMEKFVRVSLQFPDIILILKSNVANNLFTWAAVGMQIILPTNKIVKRFAV